MKIDLLKYLRENFSGKMVYFYPNPGNAGDSLIALSEYIIFSGLNIDARTIRSNKEIPQGSIVFYGGGGNFVQLYKNARRFLEVAHLMAGEVLVLPHTIRGNEDLIGKFSNNVKLICRESRSYDFVSKICHSNCYLADDVALYLPVNKILNRDSVLGYGSYPKISIRNAKRIIRIFIYAVRNRFQSEVLDAFRTDAESGGGVLEGSNFDVSQMFAADDMSYESCLETGYFFVWFLSRFKKIRTDRLHVCIVAALLGKDVELFDNSYGKNRDVYEYSMRSRFPNVTLK